MAVIVGLALQLCHRPGIPVPPEAATGGRVYLNCNSKILYYNPGGGNVAFIIGVEQAGRTEVKGQ